MASIEDLNESQQEHLNCLEIQAKLLIRQKYIAGAAAHREEPDLEDLPAERLLDEAIGEAVDQLVYLLTLRDALNKEVTGG